MYLESQEASDAMLQQAKDNGIYELLKVPIILLMACVIFNQKESLPKSKTDIFDTIFELLMDRTTLKTFGCKSGEIANLDELLCRLGELFWKALQNDIQQLLLNKVWRFPDFVIIILENWIQNCVQQITLKIKRDCWTDKNIIK